MSTVASELMGALITSAAPEVLPFLGRAAGSLFGVPAVSRIAAGTMWNLCNNKRPSSDVEMQELGRFTPRGRSRSGAIAPQGSWLRPGSNSVIRLNRTYENNVIRRKQRFEGFMVGGQAAAALATAVLGLLAKLSVITLALSPTVLLVIAGALAVNMVFTMLLANHYKMGEFTEVPHLNENNWDLIDTNAIENQSNLNNTLWFAISSLPPFSIFACLDILLNGAGNGYEERERCRRNN